MDVADEIRAMRELSIKQEADLLRERKEVYRLRDLVREAKQFLELGEEELKPSNRVKWDLIEVWLSKLGIEP